MVVQITSKTLQKKHLNNKCKNRNTHDKQCSVAESEFNQIHFNVTMMTILVKFFNGHIFSQAFKK